MKIKLYYIVNLFFFFCLNPNISFYPINTDVQPPSFVLAIFLFIYIGVKHSYKFDYLDILFIIIGIYSILYFYPNSSFILQKRVAIIAAFFVYYIIKYYNKYFSIKVYYASILLNFTGALFHLFFPHVFIPIAELFVRTIKISNPMSSYRGVSGFFSEPDFLGAISVFYLVFLFYFLKIRKVKISKLIIASIFVMCISMSILSKSGTGIIYILIFLFFIFSFYFFKSLKIALASIPSLIVLHYLFYNSFKGRGLSILKELMHGNISILLIDTSIAQRVSNFLIGFIAVLLHPFGFGAGRFSYASKIIVYKFHLYNIFYTLHFKYFLNSVSAIGLYLVEIGLPFFLFLFILFLSQVKLKYLSLIAYFYAILFLSFTFSFAYPPTWILIACFSKNTIKSYYDYIHLSRFS